MQSRSTEDDIITSLTKFAKKREIMVPIEGVLKVAQLVKIKLSDDEIRYYSKELTMLSWIRDALLKVNTKGISPMRYGTLDPDINFNSGIRNPQDSKKEEILSNSRSEHGYFVVPKSCG